MHKFVTIPQLGVEVPPHVTVVEHPVELVLPVAFGHSQGAGASVGESGAVDVEGVKVVPFGHSSLPPRDVLDQHQVPPLLVAARLGRLGEVEDGLQGTKKGGTCSIGTDVTRAKSVAPATVTKSLHEASILLGKHAKASLEVGLERL